MPRRTLRFRIVTGLLGYTVLLSAVVLVSGELINEREEFVIQHALLDTELDSFVQRRALHADSPPPNNGLLRTYVVPRGAGTQAIPEPLRPLAPGLYDEVRVGSRDVTVLVRDVGADRIWMTVDLTHEESAERRAFRWALGCVLLGSGVIAWAIWWLSGRLLRPVSRLAQAIDAVAPEVREQRLELAPNSENEVATITRSVNRYLERMDEYVKREGAFIRNVSHELRTPIAVIAGAAEILEGASAPLGDGGRRALARIRQTTADMDRMVTALLVLARSPAKLRGSGESCRLEQLVPAIVEAHAFLGQGKRLDVKLGAIAPGAIDVSGQIATVAIANLLRNAIENTDQGEVSVSVEPAGVLRIHDTGRGMSPEEIGRTYAAKVRDDTRSGGYGIGLPLIRHICEHLGWTLELESGPGSGTLAVLDMRRSLLPS